MATYVNDLRLKEITTGDESGTWGTSTNTNLELIAEAFSYGTEASFSSDADATTTIADGSTDPARSLYLKVTSGASLTATRTLTIAPNTVSKVWIIENATSGSQSINISQGSGANVTIPNGDVKVVYSDGAGSGAAIVDAFTDLNLAGTTTVDVLSGSGNATIGGTLGVTGAVTADAGVSIDNITIDGTEIDLSSGDLTIDVAGDINLDADGADINLKDGGTAMGRLGLENGDLNIASSQQDYDIKFKGNDGGATITALSLDMSQAGYATFNSGVSLGGETKLGDSSKLIFGDGDDLQIYHDGSNSYIQSATGNFNLTTANGAEFALTAVNNGAVTLFYDGSSKLATASTGVDVTGALTEDSNRVATNGRAIAFSLLF